MAARGETGWQSGKTVAECNRYMLDNEISTDVCFEVGPPDGDIVKINAHKYMLISRSPVFEAMFSSGMAESRNDPESTIRVEDIEAHHFKEMLIFMYCGHSDVTLEEVPAVLYAANKYMLKGLHQLCSKLIQNSLDEDSVYSALELSFRYDDKSLEDKCLQFISDNSEALLSGDKIQSLSRQGMEAVVKLERIGSSESTIYRACIAWAKHQLARQEITSPTGKEIRETLGSIIKDIRFPVMGITEFAKLVGTSDILTHEETSVTYYYRATWDITEQLVFNTRGRQEFVINRFDSVTHSPIGEQCNSCKSVTFSFDTVEFEADRDIVLTGLGFYAGFKDTDYAVKLEIKHFKQVQLREAVEGIYIKEVVVRGTKNLNIVKWRFPIPIQIEEGVRCKITALAKGIIGHSGYNRTAGKSRDSRLVVTSKAANVTLNFYDCTSQGEGQVPRIYFMLPD